MDDKNVYFICSDRGQIEKLQEEVDEKVLQYSQADGKIQDYQDLIEIRRQISESGVIVAAIDQSFNYKTHHQYELAISILLEKDIAILSDGTPLSPEFSYNFLCIINRIEHTEWAEYLVELINGRRTEERTINVSKFQRDKLLLFTWSIEEEVARNGLAQKDIAEINYEEIPFENESVSHRLLCSLLTRSEENIAARVNHIPKEIKELCKRHQKKITKCHIRQIGRQLDLDDDHLDAVDTFYEHGIPEMFWQLVKIWHESFPDRVSAKKLRKALKSCNINTEETHMPLKHKKILAEMTEYLIDNMVDIDIFMPQLISENVLDDRTKPYVTSPRTHDQRSLRLLEVLETKEHGMKMIINVFNKTGYDFLSNKIIERLPELKGNFKKKLVLAVTPSPRSSCSSETSLKVFSNQVRSNSKDKNQQRRSSDRLQEFKSYSAPASLWTQFHNVVDDKHSIMDTDESAIEFDMNYEFDKRKSRVHTNHKLCCLIS